MQALSIFAAWPDGPRWTHVAAAALPMLLALAVILGVAMMIARGLPDA